jgi:hypothetical protein
VHTDNQHIFVVRAIEDADPPALRQSASGSPEKVVRQFFRARLFEAEDLAALRIDPGHDVSDRAILSGAVHTLENQQQCAAVGRIVETLLRAQFLDVFL